MREFDDNPAGRLRMLLVKVHQNCRDQNAPAWDATAKVLAPAAAPTSPDALRAMTHLMELPAGIRAAVDALDEDEEEKSHLLDHLDKVEGFLARVMTRHHSLGQACQGFASGGDITNSAAVQSLSNCSRRLHRFSPEPRIPHTDMAELVQSVTTLMEDVRASNLEASAKSLLLHHLHRLLQALDLIHITGAIPVEENLDSFFGAVTHHPGVLEEARRRGFGERLDAVAGAIRTLFNVARGVHQLGSETHAAIEQGTRAIEHARNLLG